MRPAGAPLRRRHLPGLYPENGIVASLSPPSAWRGHGGTGSASPKRNAIPHRPRAPSLWPGSPLRPGIVRRRMLRPLEARCRSAASRRNPRGPARRDAPARCRASRERVSVYARMVADTACRRPPRPGPRRAVSESSASSECNSAVSATETLGPELPLLEILVPRREGAQPPRSLTANAVNARARRARSVNADGTDRDDQRGAGFGSAVRRRRPTDLLKTDRQASFQIARSVKRRECILQPATRRLATGRTTTRRRRSSARPALSRSWSLRGITSAPCMKIQSVTLDFHACVVSRR